LKSIGSFTSYFRDRKMLCHRPSPLELFCMLDEECRRFDFNFIKKIPLKVCEYYAITNIHYAQQEGKLMRSAHLMPKVQINLLARVIIICLESSTRNAVRGRELVKCGCKLCTCMTG
jgi:hypothetical protein